MFVNSSEEIFDKKIGFVGLCGQQKDCKNHGTYLMNFVINQNTSIQKTANRVIVN